MQAIPHGNRRYNWEKWVDGKWRKAKPGRDFFCSPVSFRNQVLQKSREIGATADTRMLENGVVAFVICPKDAAKNI